MEEKREDEGERGKERRDARVHGEAVGEREEVKGLKGGGRSKGRWRRRKVVRRRLRSP